MVTVVDSVRIGCQKPAADARGIADDDKTGFDLVSHLLTWGLTWVKLEHAFNQRAAAHRLEWLAFIVQLGQQQKKVGRSIKSADMSKKDKRGT